MTWTFAVVLSNEHMGTNLIYINLTNMIPNSLSSFRKIYVDYPAIFVENGFYLLLPFATIVTKTLSHVTTGVHVVMLNWKQWNNLFQQYDDVIMGAMAFRMTRLTIVYSTVYSGEDQRKHQRSGSLAFVTRIHRWPVNSTHKGPVTRKMFPYDDVIMNSIKTPSHTLYMFEADSSMCTSPCVWLYFQFIQPYNTASFRTLTFDICCRLRTRLIQ